MSDPALLSDPLLLSRIQFAANITFHILFPTISMALGWFLVYWRAMALKTGEAHYMESFRFWLKVFALTFALGVVSGITMSFQFGTNWPGFMNTVGNVAGPLLAYEVMTAFYLEATFLGILLFGSKRVSDRLHLVAAVIVALGMTVSATWIIALNSWMHTPAGFEMVAGKAHVTSWVAVIFNPSFLYRLTHMLLASGLTCAFLIAGVSAYRLLKNAQQPGAGKDFKLGVLVAAVLIPLQIAAGDAHGLNTLEYQPAKVAAMEGLWETEKGAPMVVFALPNQAAQRNDLEVTIPKLASLYLTHSLDGEVKGLKDFEDAPKMAPVFYAFRIMVGTGMLMLAISWFAALQMYRKKEPSPRLLKVFIGMTFSGWVAVVSGWYVTEIGRQPWLVTGVLKVADAVGTAGATAVASTLVMYLVTYSALIAAYVYTVFYMARKASV